MASAVFACPFVTGMGPDLSALGEAGLYYTEGGELKGGYSCIGHVPYPIPPNTCLVRVWASEDCIAEMAQMDDYLFIEEVVDAPPQP